MSNLINKAKEAISGNNTTSTTSTTSTYDHSGQPAQGNLAGPLGHSGAGHRGADVHEATTTSATAGPHSSNIVNKLDPRVDSDADHRNNPTSGVGGYGQTQGAHTGHGMTSTQPGYGTTSTTTGRHGGTGLTSSEPGYGATSTTTGHTGTAGPHSSNLANKVDPRVDSDVDHRNNPTSGVGGYGQTQTTHGGAGVGTTGPGYGATSATTGQHAGTAGPHSSNLANKLDPRVDSDVDHRNNPTSGVGGYGQTQGTHGGTGVATTGSGYGTTSTHAGAHHGTAGPHTSNMANKADPRVDSDADHRNNPVSGVGGYGQTQNTYGGAGAATGAGYGTTTTHSGAHHGTAGHGTAGPHTSNVANKADPRVDSDADHRNNPASGAGGYGQTQGTHGGHGHSGISSTQPGYGTTGTSGTHHHGATGASGATGATSATSAHDATLGTSAGVPMQSTKVHDSKLLNKLDPRTKTDSEGNPV